MCYLYSQNKSQENVCRLKTDVTKPMWSCYCSVLLSKKWLSFCMWSDDLKRPHTPHTHIPHLPSWKLPRFSRKQQQKGLKAIRLLTDWWPFFVSWSNNCLTFASQSRSAQSRSYKMAHISSVIKNTSMFPASLASQRDFSFFHTIPFNCQICSQSVPCLPNIDVHGVLS